MISRVAESCFWLHRYMERVENTARMLQVNVWFLLDVDLPVLNHWRPALIVAGEDARFRSLHDELAADDAEAVQEYLVWDDRNPTSVVRSLGAAREHARTIRDTISLEAWAAVNSFWLWLRGGAGRRLYGRDRHAFYDRVRESCYMFHGVCADTMLYNEPFDFMRLGMLLERAGQTARILDIKYHNLGPTHADRESPAEAAQWLAILRSCSATEPFFKRSVTGPTGPAVAEFLLLDVVFPRAVLYCLNRAWHFLQRIRPPAEVEIGARSAELLDKLVRRLRTQTIDRLLASGIHAELTTMIDGTAEVCDAVAADYFAADLGQAAVLDP